MCARYRQGRDYVASISITAMLYFVVAIGAASIAIAESDTIEFNIPAQHAASALNEFARQASVRITFLPNELGATKTNAVVGRFSRQKALLQLIAGTGLKVSYYSGSAASVHRVSESGTEPFRKRMMDSGFDHLSRGGSLADRSWQALRTSAEIAKSSAIASSQGEEEIPKELADVVVTGTQIRGPGPVGGKVITITREDIDRSGLATLQEILERLPQNFSGGPTEDTATTARVGGNPGFGSSINLRGLGADSTLVLLNGRRQAPSGSRGSFVDISTIALSAVDRVEILPDGASALYGSDAVGGVVNIIMRKDYVGAETRLRYGPNLGDDVRERKLGQIIGTSWLKGNFLIAYEYYDRSHLFAQDRDFTKDSNLTRLGGDDRSGTSSNPGNIVGSGMTFAIPAGQDGTNLTVDQLLPGVENLQNILEGVSTLPSQERHSGFLALSHDIGDRINLNAEARFGKRDYEHFATLSTSRSLTVPSTNPFFVDPFGGSTTVRVRYSLIDDLGNTRVSGDTTTYSGTIGAQVNLGTSWQSDVSITHHQEEIFSLVDNTVNSVSLSDALADPNPTTAFNAFGDGSNTNPATLDAIQGFSSQKFVGGISMVNFKADGNVFHLKAGSSKIAVGAEFRKESLENDEIIEFTNTPTPVDVSDTDATDFDREVIASFAELYVPLVNERNARAGIRRFELSLAARFENYSDFGSTLNPKVGVLWEPLDALRVRGTYGTSFKAPVLFDLRDVKNIFRFNVPNPTSPSGSTQAIFIIGNEPGLDPEEAETWTFGIDLSPSALKGFELSVSHFTVRIDDRIADPIPNSIFEPLQNPSLFSEIVTIDPDPEIVTELFNEPGFRSSPIPPEEVEIIIDTRTTNIARVNQRGLDLTASYGFARDAGGVFEFVINASYLLEFEQAFNSNAQFIETFDTIHDPVDFRVQGSLAWNHPSGLSAAIFGNYTDDYTDDQSLPERSISSWTTWDLNLQYDFSNRANTFWDGAKASLSVVNLFDEDPPFANTINGFGFDSLNASATGRLIALQFTKGWQ